MSRLVHRFLRHLSSFQETQLPRQDKPRRRPLRLLVEPLEERVLLSLAVLPDQPLPTGTNPLDVQLGRIDTDNTVDLAALGADGHLTIALNNGDNFWRSAQTTDLGVGPSNGLALGLFGSDPFLDAVVQGPNTLTLARGEGSGHFTVAQSLTPGAPGTLAPTGGGRVQLATALLNGDPFTDLVTVAPGTNEVLVFLGNAAGTLGTPARYPSGASQPVAVAVGDFVGNNLADLAVGHRDGSVTFLQGLPGGAFLPRPDLTAAGLGAVTGLATGNFDGSGPELAISSANGVTLLKNNHHLVALTDPVANGDFSAGLSGWTTFGPVTAAGNFAQLQENTAALTTTLQQT
jgi:hypothetical protein